MTKEKSLDFEKMSFEQLISESEKEAADAWTGGDWREFEEQVQLKAPRYFVDLSIVELEQFYKAHPHSDLPYWFSAWTAAYLECWPFSMILEKITDIERSLSVLLKKYGNDDAGITINQLIKLKKGQ